MTSTLASLRFCMSMTMAVVMTMSYTRSAQAINLSFNRLGELAENKYDSVFQQVENHWDAHIDIDDDLTIVIDVDFEYFEQSSQNEGILSVASPVMGTIVDSNSNEVWMTRANGQALGVVESAASEIDGTILLNNAIKWDLKPENGINNNSFDLVGTLAHEVGHLLGFASGSNLGSNYTTLADLVGLENSHLENEDALMYPFLDRGEVIAIHNDDVDLLENIGWNNRLEIWQALGYLTSDELNGIYENDDEIEDLNLPVRWRSNWRSTSGNSQQSQAWNLWLRTNDIESTQVPEGGSILGLVGFLGLMGTYRFFKGSRNQ